MHSTYNIDLCKAALIEHGWEQKDLAGHTGLSESVVSKFFRGETVRNRTASAIIHKLGLKVKHVLIDTEDLVEVGADSRKKRAS